MQMQGFINETHMEAAEAMFPGIRAFYRGLRCKPTTFLELLWEYFERLERCPSSSPPTRASRRARPAR
jgi:hypothetical protein